MRSLDRGYPFFTENGNIILDCNFGVITNPKILTQKNQTNNRCFRIRYFSKKTRYYLQSQKQMENLKLFRNNSSCNMFSVTKFTNYFKIISN